MRELGVAAVQMLSDGDRDGNVARAKRHVRATAACGGRLGVLPQASRVIVLPMTGNCMNIIKDTALASVVAMPDFLKQATQARPSPPIPAR